MTSPETGPSQKDVKERPEQMEIPPEVERATGAKTSQIQFTKQVTDDSGKPMIQTPSTQQVKITIPANQTQLDDWSQGSADDSLTWFAVYWLRLIKKAFHFGWRVFMKKEKDNAH